METIQINVYGMTCNGCVNSVTKVLQALPGVGSVEVSLEGKRAVVQYDPTQSGIAQFKAAIEDAGFDVG
jgi:copper chaperone